jgi:hypothetical protein
MIEKPPITSSEIPDQWIADCREALNRHEGVPIRAHATEPAIERWSINRNAWGLLMLPGSGTHFTNTDERNAVLVRLRA